MKEWFKFKSSKDAKKFLGFFPRGDRKRSTGEDLWPISLDYHSNLNPIFLYAVPDLDFFSFAKHWLVRDGLVALFKFFDKHPEPPKNWSSRLFFHAKFIPYIPPKWRAVCGAYQIKCKEPALDNIDTLLFSGLVSPRYCSLESLERQLEEIKNFIGKTKLESSNIQSLLFVRQHNLNGQVDPSYTSKYFFSLCHCMGSNIHPLTFQQMMAMKSLSRYLIFDLNDYKICADSQVVHSALSQGAYFLNPTSLSSQPNLKGAEYFPISSFHGMEVVQSIKDYKFSEKTWITLQALKEYERRLYYFSRPRKSLKIQPFCDSNAFLDWLNSLSENQSDQEQENF